MIIRVKQNFLYAHSKYSKEEAINFLKGVNLNDPDYCSAFLGSKYIGQPAYIFPKIVKFNIRDIIKAKKENHDIQKTHSTFKNAQCLYDYPAANKSSEKHFRIYWLELDFVPKNIDNRSTTNSKKKITSTKTFIVCVYGFSNTRATNKRIIIFDPTAGAGLRSKKNRKSDYYYAYPNKLKTFLEFYGSKTKIFVKESNDLSDGLGRMAGKKFIRALLKKQVKNIYNMSEPDIEKLLQELKIPLAPSPPIHNRTPSLHSDISSEPLRLSEMDVADSVVSFISSPSSISNEVPYFINNDTTLATSPPIHNRTPSLHSSSILESRVA